MCSCAKMKCKLRASVALEEGQASRYYAKLDSFRGGSWYSLWAGN